MSARDPRDGERADSAADDGIPVSVRLGTVVPPEDPEDWTQPLTWLAALGMLAGPLAALLWFALAQPRGTGMSAITWVLAAVLVAGASLTGATQIGAGRAFAGTLGAALFAALGTVILGVAFASQRQVGTASPTLVHAFVGAVAGLFGGFAAAAPAAALARQRRRDVRWAVPAAVGVATALLVVALFGSL